MVQEVQVFAIKGFDMALIGTAYRGTNEVLVYDGYIAESLVPSLEPKATDLLDYLDKIKINKLGDRAPVFVFLNEMHIGDTADAIAGPGTPIH